MGTLSWIDLPVCQGTEIEEPDRRAGPMEPPIGYGLTYRSIFPESQFGKDDGSVFQGGGREYLRQHGSDTHPRTTQTGYASNPPPIITQALGEVCGQAPELCKASVSG
jgi:hypothetical protein